MDSRWVMALVLLVPLATRALGDPAVAPLYPPLVTSHDGVTADGGQAYDLVMEAARRVGKPVTVTLQPFARATRTAQTNPGTLLFPVIRTPEREDEYEWLGAVNEVNYQLFRLKAVPARAKPGSLQDLGAARIGVITDDAVDLRLGAQGRFSMTRASELGQLVQMLVSQRIDYVASTSASVAAALRNLGLDPGIVEPAIELSGIVPGTVSYLVVAKGIPKQTVLAWQQAFRAMRADGTSASILARYTHP